ncbi:MAG: response regulator [SAR324 cluster bacterium]|nr:response regulator [SAR324 cluster bacterium]
MENILIVDDEQLVCRHVEAILQKLRYQTGYVTDPDYVIPTLQDESFSLILLDINMPRKDGITLLKELRNHATFREIPVIMLTADTTDKVLATCFENGAADYITKPLNELVLKARIGAVLATRNHLVHLRRVNQHLRYINEMKSRFVAMVTHEFRNPLMVMLNTGEYLESFQKELSEEDMNKCFKRIQTSAQNMSQLVDDILILGQSDEQNLTLNTSQFDVISFCKELVTSFELMPQNTPKIKFHAAIPSLSVSLDRKWLHYILSNLLSNAIKYSPDGQNIIFEISEENSNVLLTIQDHGIGIPENDQLYLFQPFHRGTNVKTIHGTGLGLSIAKKGIDLHQGRIEFKSSEGNGTTFKIYLPKSIVSQQVFTQTTVSDSNHASVSQKFFSQTALISDSTTILVIDDDLDLLNSTSLLLKKSGYQALGFQDGHEALQFTKNHRVDLILCDILMPEIHGYDVFTTIKKNPETCMIPFIFMTGRGEKRDFRKAMELGAEDYLQKPFSAAELRQAIAIRLEKREQVVHKYEKKLEQLRENITYALPHELRTALFGINGSAEILLRNQDQMPPEDIRQLTGIIYDSGKKLHKVIEKFLMYASLELESTRPQSSQSRQKVSLLNPVPTIMTCAMERARHYKRSNDLQMDLKDISIKILDEDLEAMMHEVLDNAFKFSIADTQVQITSGISQQGISIEIRNSGRGMTSEQITSIGAYMQFGRKKYEQQGLGLGLALVTKLMDIYRGKFQIESIPDQFTLVTLSFPLSDL